MSAASIWQAYDCPLSGIDFDLDAEHLVHQGQKFYCSACGQEHTAGVDVEVETFVETPAGLQFPDLPADQAALNALRAGVGQ